MKKALFIGEVRGLIALSAAVAISACGDSKAGHTIVIEANNSSQPTVMKTSIAAKRSELQATLQLNFDLATKNGPKDQSQMTQMPQNNSAGLICTPAHIDRESPTFRLVLPPRSADRVGTLAAIGPDGRLLIIYNSYGFDEDPEDLVIPSKYLDWQLVQEQSSFLVDARKFDALPRHAIAPELLFHDKGIYQFALLNSDARDLLELNKLPFWVIAGCVVEWTP